MHEYRIYTKIPNLPLEPEDQWEPLMTLLEHDHSELGPIIGWEDDTAVIILALNAEDESDAASKTTAVLAAALRASGLGDHYPAELEIELIDAEREAAAL